MKRFKHRSSKGKKQVTQGHQFGVLRIPDDAVIKTINHIPGVEEPARPEDRYWDRELIPHRLETNQ